MIRIVALLAVVVASAQCQKSGGMAELKSITGDAPYDGVGNAPALPRQPMGFWGRPRYSPMAYSGPYGGSMFGFNPYAPVYDPRFTSISGSPYGLGTWETNI
ncbi:unnamed protein product [Caenorhabditis auriculariae]|uniref:Uncharacterized protein n=1 Tax=Caenorhabditis auriculariae TaxID=2777116 RepID=A0A8S1HGT0_9PELO|nr:unnamed protein product [Caenorhabditis auriculariae]